MRSMHISSVSSHAMTSGPQILIHVYSVRSPESGCHLGLGDISGFHGCRRAARTIHQCRMLCATYSVPSFRDGRGIDGEAGASRRNRPDCALLRDALAAGAFGFSTTNTLQHTGYKGRPLACRLASTEELRAYAGVLRELGKGVIEIALTRTRGQIRRGMGVARDAAQRKRPPSDLDLDRW